VLVAVHVVKGIHISGDNLWTPFIAALVLGILNAFIRPIMMLLALPLLIFTLGLFMLVINAVLLYFVGFLLRPYFYVDDFGSAFLGALIISVITLILNTLTGAGGSRVEFRRGKRPGDDDRKDGDNGPVIDV
jgi:putative membrane protein